MTWMDATVTIQNDAWIAMTRKNDELLAALTAALEQNERLLADIERWNATIAVGQAKAESMEAVISAARAYVEDDSDANWTRLNDTVAAHDANPTPLPTAFVRDNCP